MNVPLDSFYFISTTNSSSSSTSPSPSTTTPQHISPTSINPSTRLHPATTMQLTTILVAAISVLPSALAGNAIVKNNCAFPISYRSNGNNKVVQLASKGTYSEGIVRGGSAIQLG